MRISDWSSDVCSSDLLSLQFLVLDDDEQQAMLMRQPAGGADHQVGAGRVGEFGEQDDQRAPVEPGAPRREREGEIVFDRGIDRKSVVEGESVSVRVDLGGGQIIKKQKMTA